MIYRCQGLLYPAANVASHFVHSIDTDISVYEHNMGSCVQKEGVS